MNVNDPSPSSDVQHPNPGAETGNGSGVRETRYLKAVGRTALLNAASVLVSAATGVLLARLLGPDGRGDYAAVTAFFGLSLVVFEIGLPAALVFLVSRQRDRAGSYTGTTTTLLLVLSLIGGAFVAVSALLLPGGSADRQSALLLASACVVARFAGTPAIFALQALSLTRWNLVRLAQPLLFAALLAATALALELTVTRVIAVLGVSLGLQGVLAWYFFFRLSRSRLRFSKAHIRPLFRFGSMNLASAVPNSVNGRFDQVLLALLVAPAALGQYAVAVTLSLLVSPLAFAFGNVAFPRIAGGGDPIAVAREALRGSFLVAIVGVAAVVAAAPIAVPLLYGPGFGDVPRLLLILAPGAAFFVVNQVLGDLLRGLGRPSLVAWCEWIGVVLTVAGLLLLVPYVGSYGAAVTSTITYAGVHVLLRFAVRGEQRRKEAGTTAAAM